MEAITWDENAENEDGSKGAWVKPKTNAEWYDYQEKKWANAVIKNEKGEIESYWVWIPRYAYQIEHGETKGYHQAECGTITVKFLQGTEENAKDAKGETLSVTTNPEDGTKWLVHPAFKWKEKPISGIWVAKFEASNGKCTTEEKTGREDTNRTDLKLQVKPGVTSWRNITIGNMFTVCKNYKTNLNSHLMKNSEWGVVAYLSKSTNYGIGDIEVTKNDNNSYLTGGGKDNAYVTSNVAQSTTGTAFGVYDMNGGSWEYVATYLDNDYTKSGQTRYMDGQALIEEIDMDMKEVYNVGKSDTSYQNYEANKQRYGDAICETSSLDTSGTAYSWFNSSSFYPWTEYPYFVRGGVVYGGDSRTERGIFVFNRQNGSISVGMSFGFRVVLIIS